MLQPAFTIVGQRVNVTLIPVAKGDWQPSWRFLAIAIDGDELFFTDPHIGSLMEEANKAAASRVVMRVPEGGLLLGILNQRRFWTSSRAAMWRLPHATRTRCLSAWGQEMSAPGFFTQDVVYELPHPPIPRRLILIIHAVVERGLQLLRESPPPGFALGRADEDSITLQLHWVIANRLYKSKEVAGFDRRTFGKPRREPKMTNFDGNHPDKMPDLVFFLNRDTLPVLLSHDALVAECKPVDKDHPAGGDYCDMGLKRFVIGDYAWPMQEAMMVGYIRDGRSFAANLLPAMAQRRDDLGTLEELSPVGSPRAAQQANCMYVSVHSRAFNWLAGRGRACNIRIFHSWHFCS